jgi:type I restriction enzyme M protein
MNYKQLITMLGFSPKENTVGIFSKKYPQADDYCIEVNFEKQAINYGNLIISDSKTTQNFSQPENFVVLECINRLLEKGYKPENIILEKTWAAGHGTSGRLDICVNREDGSEYLLIECKTCGKEFDREFARMKKDGGQLFTYFKFSNKADVIMLYASELKGNEIIYHNEIIKIEEDYRTGDVKDFYEKWNKLTNDNGVWESSPYNFKPKAKTINELEDIKQEDSSFIFNRFLEILRHNVVSDKPNAFNKIFTLFLCKIYDEKDKEGTNEELDFQWIEGKDDDISFQLRLTDLYKNGMKSFLEKAVTDFSDEEFENQYASLFAGNDELKKKFKENVIHKLRLEKNNEFAIKEVYDEKSFKENARVVKEMVELLQNYKIRYTKKQQYLSDFFELLLTTGLKQESGQFFTPVPIAQFVIKSLPIDKKVNEKLTVGKKNDLIPYVIDYAAGSGHFLIESMHEIQRLLANAAIEKLKSEAKELIAISKIQHFNWAEKYVYGVEKDYRLVKVCKVGCYLHGDGLANVIHSDGLANFKHSDYKDKLREIDKNSPKENRQFDILVSNPPYSVSAFKNAARDYYTDNDFEIYDNLTDNSSEIECLFVERTKQLLKDGGVAGVILPSSILSNEGIYTKAREIILQNFEIVAITELGSNTFMATGTNTVVLFLRRINNYDSINLRKSIERFFDDFQDVTRNGIEKPVSKYVNHVWENLTFDNYISLLKKAPDNTVINHDIYKEYRKKIKAKTEKDFWNSLFEIEKEKLYYFILAYPQKTVLVKTGEKDAEKRFLGYEFSNRRGSEGIHPIQRGKTIDECTKLFDEEVFDNPEKASTYIYKAFAGDYNFPIHETLKNNISRVCLVDMLTFDRESFAKNISTVVLKRVKFETIWNTDNIVPLSEVSKIQKGTSITKEKTIEGSIPVVAGGKEPAYFHNYANRKGNVVTVSASGAYSGFVNYFESPIFASDCNTVQSKNENTISTKLIYLFLKSIQKEIYGLQRGQAQPHVYAEDLVNIKIPFPSKEIQQKIVSEIEVLEKKEEEAKKNIEGLKNKFENFCLEVAEKYDKEKLMQLAITNPSKSEISHLDTNTLISFVDMPAVSNDGYIANKVDKLFGEIRKGSYTYFKEGDIIIAKITPCMENGKCALATNLTNGLALGSSEFHVFRANNNKIDTKFLFTLLNRKFIRTEAEKNMTGASGHRRVPIAFYENLEIPLPPLSEQQRIVSKIETIETQITELERQLAEIPKQKENILTKYL